MGTFLAFATLKQTLTSSESDFPIKIPPVCLKIGRLLILASS